MNIYKQYGMQKVFWVLIQLFALALGLCFIFGVYDELIAHFKHNGQVSLTGSLLSGGFGWINNMGHYLPY